MTDHEFEIPVRDLDAAGKPFRFPVRAAWLRGALEGTSVAASEHDGQLELRLSKSGTDVVVRGTLEARVTAPCSRCLEPAAVAVNEAISALAVPATTTRESPGNKDDDDISPEQADLIPYDGENLVLDDLVRDELLLAIPMIPLCSEACPGIHPQLSSEERRATEQDDVEDIDPRLRPLLQLKKNTKQKQ
jgi:uncharacterized protein